MRASAGAMGKTRKTRIAKVETMKRSIVGLAEVGDVHEISAIRSGLRLLLDNLRKEVGMNIPPGAEVVIKPNICTVKGPETGATVDPLLVKFLIEWMEENFDVRMFYIAEADATWLNADIAFKVLGWERIFGNLPNVHILNLTKDEQVDIDLKGHLFQNLTMSRTYMESDFLVSFGKLKTNDLCGMSCILKNQFGSLSAKYKAGFHEKLSQAIFDLNRVKIPDLCVVDGIVAMEGDGPVYGAPRPLGLIIAGNDPVSVDCMAARIMDIPVGDIPYLRYAIRHGLGSSDFRVIGTEPEPMGTGFVHSSTWRNLALRILQSKLTQIPFVWSALSKAFAKESPDEAD
jgi:uncharacterized protein (DUF362 family)